MGEGILGIFLLSLFIYRGSESHTDGSSVDKSQPVFEVTIETPEGTGKLSNEETAKIMEKYAPLGGGF